MEFALKAADAALALHNFACQAVWLAQPSKARLQGAFTKATQQLSHRARALASHNPAALRTIRVELSLLLNRRLSIHPSRLHAAHRCGLVAALLTVPLCATSGIHSHESGPLLLAWGWSTDRPTRCDNTG